MDKSEKVLALGNLDKSPTKSRDKAKFNMCWKTRLCVFSEITYSSLLGKETKLVLNYFKDKKSYKNDEPPKGQLNLSDWVEIKNHFKSQAGYHHIFSIQCLDGKFVKFSPSSCEEKLKWLTLLCKYTGKKLDDLFEYDSRTSRSSSLADDFDTSEVKSETSSLASDSSDGVLVDNEGGGLFQGIGRCDSGTFSTSTVSSSGSSLGIAPPLPPPRNSSTEFRPSQSDSETERLQYGVEGNRDSGIFQTPSEPNGRDQKILGQKLGSSILCENCLAQGKRKKKSILRRVSNTKQANADQMIEVERGDNGACAREPSIPDVERISHQSLSSDDSFSYEDPHTIKYTEIDEEFLQQVDQFVKLQDEEEFGNKADYDDDDDYGIYVPMNLFWRKEPEDDKNEFQDEENLLLQGLRISEHAYSNEIPSDKKETTIDKEAPMSPVPTSTVPTSPVPSSPVPTSPVPTSTVPSCSEPSSPVPTSPVPSCSEPTSPVPSSPVPSSSEPSSLVPTSPVPSCSEPSSPVPSSSEPSSFVPTSTVPSSPVPTSLVPTSLVSTTENVDKPKQAFFFIMDL